MPVDVSVAEMIGDALNVGFADEGFIPAATFCAARRTGDVIGQLFEVIPRELDNATDRAHERGVVVVLVDPLPARDFVRIVIASRFLVELDRDVLFVDLDSVDVFERAGVE